MPKQSKALTYSALQRYLRYAEPYDLYDRQVWEKVVREVAAGFHEIDPTFDQTRFLVECNVLQAPPQKIAS